MSAYSPRPGSIGERSVARLRVCGRRRLRDLADDIDADVGSMSASLALCITHGLIVRDVVDGDIYFDLPASQKIAVGEAVELKTWPPSSTAGHPPNVMAVYRAEDAQAEPTTGSQTDTSLATEDSIRKAWVEMREAEMQKHERSPNAQADPAKPKVAVGLVGTRGVEYSEPTPELQRVLDEWLGEAAVQSDAQPEELDEPDAGRHCEFGLYSDGRMMMEIGDATYQLSPEETRKLWHFVCGLDEEFVRRLT